MNSVTKTSLNQFQLLFICFIVNLFNKTLYNQIKEDENMIHIQRGDLLQSDCTVIAYQCNCFATMGAGIAKQIKQRYPEAYGSDRRFPIPIGSRKRLGHFSKAQVGDRLIYNLYGQYRYGRGKQTELSMLENPVHSMLEDLRQHEGKIGFPYGMGAGLAGGDWNEIEKMLERCSEEFKRDLFFVQLN